NLSIDLAGVGYTLIAQASGLGGDESSAFNIVPGPPSGATSLITANPTAITADGASTSTITVQLLDANGNPLTLGGDNVALSTNHGSLGGVLDNGDGTYTAILTASTLPQTATITGTVNATPITDTATVAFVIGSADRLEIVQQPSTTAVGALFVPRVSVRVVDANGNTVPSFTGPISVAIGNNPGGGSLIGTTTVNAVGGTATFPNLAISQAGSGYTLVFSGAGFTPVTSIPFTVTAGGASGATSTITANPTSIPADGASTSTITVQLKDGGGSNETNGGDLVTLSTTAGTLSSVTDNNDGTYTATLTSSTTAGTATITGTVNGGPIASSAAVTFSAGSADLAITAAVNNPNPTLGSTIVYTITVTNSGPDTATGVQVTDALPSRLSLVSAEASQGTFTVATGVWNVGELEPGASATLALTANVGP
ncbi:MAG: invasin domain 3-containing protein, partial [Gemmatimonadota bacterium]